MNRGLLFLRPPIGGREVNQYDTADYHENPNEQPDQWPRAINPGEERQFHADYAQDEGGEAQDEQEEPDG